MSMDTGKVYVDADGNECSILQMVRRDAHWASARIQEGEKALERVKELEARLAVYDKDVEVFWRGYD